MYAPGFALLCLCTLTTIVNALGGGRWPLGIGMNKYVCSFLGGAVINIKQTETTREVDKLPAIRTVSAEWNVPWIKAPDNASLSDSDKRHSLAQWVGIMGDDCDNVNWYPFLQAGTVVEIGENEVTTASAWVEWFPAGPHFIPDDPKFHICLGPGVAQFFQEWVIAKDRADLPIFNNVTFTNMTAIDRRGEYHDLGSGTEDYWTMIDAGRQIGIPEGINEDSFVVYSPVGKTWTPHENIQC